MLARSIHLVNRDGEEKMTTTTTPAKTEAVHLTAEEVANLSTAFKLSDAGYVRQVLALHAALSRGADVKTVSRDMADAHRANPDVPKLAESTLSYRRAAITVADMIGTDIRAWAKRSPREVADVVRTADRAGIKVTIGAVREALKPIDTAKTEARQEAAVETVSAQLEKILPAPSPSTPRAKKTTGEDETAKRETVGETMTQAAALGAVRAVTAWLETGNGSWSPDLASALASLTSAATSARKRGQAGTAKLKGETVETVAA